MINNHIRIIVMESEWILRNLSQFKSSTGSVEYHPKMRCWDCWEWQRLRLRWPSCSRSWHCGFPQWPLLARQGHCSGSRALGQPKRDDLARSMTAIRRYQQGFGIFICRFFWELFTYFFYISFMYTELFMIFGHSWTLSQRICPRLWRPCRARRCSSSWSFTWNLGWFCSFHRCLQDLLVDNNAEGTRNLTGWQIGCVMEVHCVSLMT